MWHRMLADRVMLCFTRLRSAVVGTPARRGRSDRDVSSRLPRLTVAPQKNNTPVRLMACASRDMSWRTAPTSLGAAQGRHAPAMACAAVHRLAPFLENNHSPEPPPVSCSGDKSCCRPVVTAIPADRAISPEPLTPKLLTPKPLTP